MALDAIPFQSSLHFRGCGFQVPQQKVTNAALFAQNPKLNQEVVRSRLGLEERYHLADQESMIDVACMAAERALDDAGMPASVVELVIVATWTPYQKVPSNACHIASKLGLPVMAFDVSAACSGFVYAAHIAEQFLNQGQYKVALIIGMDALSPYIDFQRKDCVFFGDGAGAAIVTAREDGQKNSLTRVYSGGQTDAFYLDQQAPYFHMDAKAIFNQATTFLPIALAELFAEAKITLDDVDLVIPHQPSRHLLTSVFEAAGYSTEKVYINVQRYGNTSAATIPIALSELKQEGKLSPGDLLLFVSIGAGMTWTVGLHSWAE
ncbi:MAG: ketoacyl-ACP synthase III [Zetaproteobacteria bacterium]|nr:ketoacyl-ACP synthase III [Zetaproteobacteria bacterium]